jgi:hypothetical protein
MSALMTFVASLSVPQRALLCFLAAFAPSCTCARVPEIAFACEADGGCEVPGFRCDVSQQLCVQRVDAGCTRSTCASVGADCGNLSDGCGGTLSCGSCDGGQACGAGALPNRCAPCDGTTPDLPDDELRDTNCDGIDGDAAHAVFVDADGGSDAWQGTSDKPVRTLTTALGLAERSNRSQVLLAAGTYSGDVNLGATASLFGGYSTPGWARSQSLSTRATILGAMAARNRAMSQPLLLQSLDVTAPAPLTGPGAPSIALALVDVTGDIAHCSFTASRGADGTAGANGAAGADGDAGSSGVCDVSSSMVFGVGGAGCGDALSAGGSGGRGGSPDLAPADRSGGPGQPSPPGGKGGTPCSGTPPCPEESGTDGEPGAAGMSGAVGGQGDHGTVSGGTWTAVRGTDGQPGSPGRGGGGGGGGAAHSDGSTGYGCSGGGGGAGGCGGLPGGGGLGGGASIGVLLERSSPLLRDVVVKTLGGGTGGAGGRGGPGGRGGAGAGPPASVPATVAGAGGDGGVGGAGGPGGAGGAGAGGPSVGIWCAGSANPTFDGTTELPGDAGSPGGLAAARLGCPP